MSRGLSANTLKIVRQWLPALCLAWLLAVGVTGPALAQQPDADVDFYAVVPEDGAVTVGDHVTLRLEVKHPADSQVELPTLDKEWGAFEVVSQTGQDTVRNGDGTAVTRKDIVVSMFEPGAYQTPRLLVTHFKADDSMEELGAPVIPLRVETVLVEGDNELRDLKDQAEMSVPPVWPLLLAGALLAVAASGGMFWAGRWAYNRWFRKEPLPVAPAPVIDTRPPELIAYAELERIEQMNLPAQNQFKEHYSLVTDCLRAYIENRYKIPALEQTTDEIRTAFRWSSNISSMAAQNFVQMFSFSDLVKFARFRPDPEHAYNLLAEARHLIDETTPRPEPEPAPALAPGQPGPPSPDGKTPTDAPGAAAADSTPKPPPDADHQEPR